MASQVKLLPMGLAALLLAAVPAPAADAAWKYKYTAVVVQNSGAHRPNALSVIELLRRLAALKPAAVSMGMFGFAREFKQLNEGRFARRTARLLDDTTGLPELREAIGEMVFHGPSPIFDAIADALEAAAAAAKSPDAVVLVVSNGIDNASDVEFDDLARRAEKSGVPIIVFYFPTNPPMNGESRLRRLAKASAGRFIDVRLRDSWDQLMSALR